VEAMGWLHLSKPIHPNLLQGKGNDPNNPNSKGISHTNTSKLRLTSKLHPTNKLRFINKACLKLRFSTRPNRIPSQLG
jgi:hypothetical protein